MKENKELVELIKEHDQQIKEMDQLVNTLAKDDHHSEAHVAHAHEHKVNGAAHSHKGGVGLCDLRFHELIQDIW